MTTPVTADLLPAKPALTATTYSFIFETRPFRDVGFEFGANGTGSPAGTWSFEGSDDPTAEKDMWTERQAGTPAGTSVTGKFFAVPAATVLGDALIIAGAGATKSYVAFSLGCPAFMRMVFTQTGGGTGGASYVTVNGRP